MRAALLALLVVVGCSAPQPRVVVHPSLAESAVAALDLWTAATEGEFSPEVVISEDCSDSTWCIVGVESLPACGDSSEALACTTHRDWLVSDLAGLGGGGLLRLNTRATPREFWVSSLAHEIGHLLGVEHRESGLMNGKRGEAERVSPCVDADTVAAAGLSGAGACLQ